MATEDQYMQSKYGVGSRTSMTQLSTMVVAGNTTVKGPIVVPTGSWLEAISIDTATAISGTPTSCLVSVGTTDGGVDIVAAVDAKAQGHIAGTIVAAFDKYRGLATLNTLFIQVVTSGGTASAGNIDVRVSCASSPQA